MARQIKSTTSKIGKTRLRKGSKQFKNGDDGSQKTLLQFGNFKQSSGLIDCRKVGSKQFPFFSNTHDDPIVIEDKIIVNNSSSARDEIISLDEESDLVENESRKLLFCRENSDAVKASAGEAIFCPICYMDLMMMGISARESHCQQCLELIEVKKESVFSSQGSALESKSLFLKVEQEDEEYEREEEGEEALVQLEKKTGTETRILNESQTQDVTEPKEKLSREPVKEVSKRKFSRYNRPKTALPYYKILSFHNGSYKLVVDGFNFESHPEISDYFLSHFHSDHYIGMKSSWEQGNIYCSEITAKLLRLRYKVKEGLVKPLKNYERVWIRPHLSVILLEANHCPGGSLFLFQEWTEAENDSELPIRQILHTGDFRSCKKIICQVKKFTFNQPIDIVYLDTTYLTPGFHFPLQESVCEVTAEFAEKLNITGRAKLFNDTQKSITNFFTVTRKYRFKYLFLVGTYSIGKEKLAIAIASKLNTKIYVPPKSPRLKTLSQYLELFPNDMITTDPLESCVHLVSLRTINDKDNLANYIKQFDADIYEEIIGFHPTGWTFTNKFAVKPEEFENFQRKVEHCLKLLNNHELYDEMDSNTFYKQYKGHHSFHLFRVPYSEHSGFKDLTEFGVMIDQTTIIATVNLHRESKVREMSEWFKAWEYIRKNELDSVKHRI